MLPTSHESPRISVTTEPLAVDTGSLSEQPSSAAQLANAFAEFVSTSSRLESSYRQLQGEVSALRAELAESDQALKLSLLENQRVRLALQQIVATMPCGVLVADAAGHVTTVNPETVRILSLDQSTSVSTIAQIARLSGIDLALFVTSGGEVEQELCLRNSGNERWLHIRSRQLSQQNPDKSEQTIFILRDVTAHKLAERDREAGRNAMALAEITTMLAHEIRNPLASLELFAGLIEDDDTRRGEWISNMRAGIRSLSGTVNNVLSFHDSRPLKHSVIYLDQAVRNTVHFMQPLADQSGITLQMLIQGSDFSVYGNESALQQVLMNLIKNAIRHTPCSGTVTVSLEQQSTILSLECSDTGRGLRSEQIEHLFQPGFSGNSDSPGLGLAVCERIVRQHGGRISASNFPGAGARFRIELPTFTQEQATA